MSRPTSGHVGIPQPFDANVWEQALHDAAVVGNHYIVHPFFGIDAKSVLESALCHMFAGMPLLVR